MKGRIVHLQIEEVVGRDRKNSSYHKKDEFNNCFTVHLKYF